MTRNSRCLPTALVSLALLTASCQKDELTVVSTAAPEHLCVRTVIELNIDSLLQLPAPPPGGADLYFTKCACDTLAFHPVNVPPDAEFDGWIIDQGEEIAYQNELDLDTITVASELWIHFDDVWPYNGTLKILVTTEPCE